MNNEAKTIYDVAKVLNVPTTTVRRYCNQGLIPHVRRNSRGFRVLEAWQVDLLAILLNMKQAGFNRKDLRQYSRLFRQGKRTEKERLAMLTTRKHHLYQEISERQRAIDFIERQEEIFQHENQ